MLVSNFTTNFLGKHSFRTIQKINPIELNILDGVLLCAKRANNDYIDLISQSTVLGCRIEIKSLGNLDTIGDQY